MTSNLREMLLYLKLQGDWNIEYELRGSAQGTIEGGSILDIRHNWF